jgi:hypothetical protein
MKIYGPDIKVNENKVTLSFVKWDCWKKSYSKDLLIYDPLERIRDFTSYGIRSKLVSGQGCEICGSLEGLQMHHVNPLKNINKKLAVHEKIKISVGRKQILVCKNCHYKIHRGHM